MAATAKKSNTAVKLTDAQVAKLEKNKRIIHSLDGRGAGAIFFDRHDGKTQAIRIGTYKRRGTKGAGFTFAELLAKGTELSNLRNSYPDLKVYIAQQAAADYERQAKKLRLEAIEASKGSFRQLFEAYILDRQAAKVRSDQIRDFYNIMKMNFDSFPEIMEMSASNIRPEHINRILTAIVDRGAFRQAAKVRSFLMAAFNFGIKQDNEVGSLKTVKFSIPSNPVVSVTFSNEHKEIIHKVGTRALSDAELNRFYNTIDANVKGVSYVMAQLFKMVIATGGQRIEQLAREPWSSYTGEIIKLVDAKGYNGKPRSHYVPLTVRSRSILEAVSSVTAGHLHPFSYLRDRHFHVTSFSQAIKRWIASEHAVIDGVRIEPFTPRDLRRTLTQLMKRYQINDKASDELQSHGLNNIVTKNYLNDPDLSIPSKTETLIALDRVLDVVLKDKKTAET